MSLNRRGTWIWGGVVLACCLNTFGQQGGNRGPRGRGRPGGRGQTFNREEFERRMAERLKQFMGKLKEELKPENDDEWQVIQMKLQEIFELRRKAYSRFYGRRGRGSSREGGDPLREARDALKELVQKQGVSNEEIKAALDKFRAAMEVEKKKRDEEEKKRAQEREEAKKKLQAAREELRSILTLRQEAVLVLYRILE